MHKNNIIPNNLLLRDKVSKFYRIFNDLSCLIMTNLFLYLRHLLN